MEDGALITSPGGVLAVLFAAVAASEVIARHPSVKRFGAALVTILLGALLANLKIIPPASAGGPIYDPIFSHVISGAIFLLLLQVNLGALKRAGAPMIGAFAIGAAGVFLGVLIANAVVPFRDAIGDISSPLAGMFAATYIGGGANFNAVAVAFDVARDSGIYTAATVVDNVMTNVWILATLALPTFLLRIPRFAGARSSRPAQPAVEAELAVSRPSRGPVAFDIAASLALAALALWLSDICAAALEMRGVTIPPILIVTTFALVAAQIPAISRLSGAHGIGLWAMYLFLTAVGANADLAALAAAGRLTPMMFEYVAVIFAVHGVLLFACGALLKLEPVVLAIASSANIGGSSTAFVLAEAEGREDLVLPAILIGSVGNALGTYLGVAMAALMR